MTATTLSLLRIRITVFVVACILLLLVGAQFVAAQDLIQPDGRINQVAHFGGDALYCVDSDFVATNQYSDFGAGGFRLLDSKGQELWFVPAATISAAVAEAKETGKGVIVAEGRGTYGPVVIYAYVTDENDDFFVFTGYDEYGKPNSLEFKFCIPVGPMPPPASEDDDDCTFVFLQKPVRTKLLGNVQGDPPPLEPIEIPCGDCPNNPDNWELPKSTYFRPLNGPGGYCLEYPVPG
jgi:hypothetical protein